MPLPYILYITHYTYNVNGQNCVATHNMFTEDSMLTHESDTIAAHFIANILPTLNAYQGEHVQNVSVYTRCATTGIDSYFTNVSGGGDRAITENEILPAFLTATVRWELDDFQHGATLPILKRSYTRFSGLIDSDIVSGRIKDDWAATYMDDISDAWKASITISGETFYSAAHVNPTEESLGWRIKGINGYMSVKLGSQNSRK